MPADIIRVRIPGQLKFIHFINDTGELLFKSHISCYSEELLNNVIQDMRVVMYELFSNAVNHSKSEFVDVEFSLSEEAIGVTCITHNEPYRIKEMDVIDPETNANPFIEPPFAKAHIGNEFIVYQDIQHEVICRVTGEYGAEFHNRKNIDNKHNVTEIPEHYGLNLITKLTHTTSYKRNQQGEDCFTITKRIR
jgi:hypothetical protein